jgi:multisubunit Na+/H+ antiporter MnhB subunit
MTEREGMSTIVRVVTRWLLGFVFVFGLAVALFGHLSPGGGFAGGVVLACGFVLATLAFGGRTGPIALVGRIASSLDAVGALAFLAVAVLGYAAGHFFQRWIARGELFTLGSATFIVLMNVAILVKVGAGVFAGFLALVVFGRLGPEEGGGNP